MSRIVDRPLVLTMTLWHFWRILLPIVGLGVLGLGLAADSFRDALTLAAFMLGFGGVISVIIGVLAHFGERVSIDGEGVHIELRSKRQHRVLPWTGYMFVYTLPGYRHTWLLFTPVMLDKDAQLAVLRSALSNTMFRLPYVQLGGNLLLSSGPVLSMRTIYRRLPPHLRVMPACQCARL